MSTDFITWTETTCLYHSAGLPVIAIHWMPADNGEAALAVVGESVHSRAPADISPATNTPDHDTGRLSGWPGFRTQQNRLMKPARHPRTPAIFFSISAIF